ncbi:Slp family lipoprotein [Trichloromonas sp.]|uniref:Slp family lipoprotein n=1 Tax=Trichloromonas sp. TaxID=3069249 RepID=UPI003D818AD8
MRLLVLIVITLLGATACSTAVSKESMELVDPSVSFEVLHQDPDRYVGRYLLLGGAITDVRPSADGGSELELVQLPTNNRGKVTATDNSDGRFIAQDTTYRDPAIYRNGRLVTLVGQVTGSKTARLGEMDYRYPVLTVHELRLWTPNDHPGSSPVHFGIGLGIGISR